VNRAEAQNARYFHGTKAKLAVGDHVLPGAEIGHEGNHSLATDRIQHVYMTLTPQAAERWAHWAKAPEDDPGPATWADDGAVVYEVEPIGELEPDGLITDAVRAPKAVVLRQVELPCPYTLVKEGHIVDAPF